MGKLRLFAYKAVGALLMAVAYKCIFDSVGLVTGGFSGIAIIVKELVGLPLWLTMAALNIPVFLVALRVKGRKFVLGTLEATVMFTVFLALLPDLSHAFGFSEGDVFLLAAIFGGVLAGLGLGLVISGLATTGGTDMAASIVQHYLPQYSVARIMQVLDALVVVAGGVVFGLESSLYAIISIYVLARVSDRVVDGAKAAKALYVISDRHEQIAQKILTELGRGGTVLLGRGLYSGDEKSVILCVTSRKQAVMLKKLVWELDREAFVIISDVREALGEGFVENVQ
jgi:uncharacterized membrane-anchored protein YitT (DUF2179 family)